MFFRAAVGAVVLVMLMSNALAQGTSRSGVLDAAVADDAVRSAAGAFAREYFDVALSRQVAAEIERRRDAGRYRELTAADLATRLTADFLELTKDKHISVAVVSTPSSPSGGGERPRRDVPTTAGFRRTEIIAGNIGVLELAFFMRAVEHRDALAAAMQTLEPADALILDMRANGGGSPETVALLIGYLLDTPGEPLFQIVHRSGSTETYRTEQPLPAIRNPRRPIYVLTSARTFSAGEGLAFLLQERKRAIVVGEVTAGAANPGRPYPAGTMFTITVPNGQVVSAIRRGNWEGRGVTPDIAAASSDAFRVAHLRAIDDLAAVASPERREELLRLKPQIKH